METLPRRIVVATDGSPDAEIAASVASDLAMRAGAELHLVHVWIPITTRGYQTPFAANDPNKQRSEAEQTLTQEVERITTEGGHVTGMHLQEGRPAEAIADLCGEIAGDLLVTGSRGHGRLRRMVLGSVAEGVLRLATCPVLVARGGRDSWPPAEIVVGDDGSRQASQAARLALRLAQLYDVPTRLIYALPDPPLALAIDRDTRDEILHYVEAVMEDRADALLDEAEGRLRVNPVMGDPAAALVTSAEQLGCPALIAVGRQGRHRRLRRQPGSVSTAVLHAAHGPVLVHP
ncbi:MAG TPA: universal stress protein [Thermomicrobiaceae bacterium]|nr:universal stress protein [Thermomicrobiaceae bacterium]